MALPLAGLAGRIAVRRPGKEKESRMRPTRAMKTCPDGSRRMASQPCPPQRMRPKVPRKPMTRTERFKRDRTTIYE